jgi:hypothetical protein
MDGMTFNYEGASAPIIISDPGDEQESIIENKALW